MKRADYISWDQYFMGIALLSAERSKDPSTQVGACIVDDNNRILSEGYNGMPAGCEDDIMPWGKIGDPLNNKYFFERTQDFIRPYSLAMNVRKQSFSVG